MSEKSKIGYTTVKKNFLKQKCDECLEYIDKERKRISENKVGNFMTIWNSKAVVWNKKFIRGRLFKREELKSLEETKAFMDKMFKKTAEKSFMGFGDREYSTYSDYAWGTESEIRSILSCCNDWSSSDDFLINIEVYSNILYRKD